MNPLDLVDPKGENETEDPGRNKTATISRKSSHYRFS